MKHIFKNRQGTVRSGWLIAMCEGIFYIITFAVGYLYIEILRQVLIGTGDIDPVTGALSPMANWLNDTILPIINQIVGDLLMIAVPLVMWRIMKYRYGDIGLKALKGAALRDGAVGLAMGFLNCTLIFCILLLTGNCVVTSFDPRPTAVWITWIFTFLLIGFAEEVMNRGFIMSVLRRTNRTWLIVLVPSTAFGLIHLSNPGVTVLSVVNIILVGAVFSYMYYKSGNLWMCVGYHISWNIFQSAIYGMPCSGLIVPSLVSAEFPAANLLNGGAFGIEGGILTTLFNIGTFVVVYFYYKDSTYRFLPAPATGSVEAAG